MDEKYWTPVLQGAWERTWKPLGGDRKKAALVLLALGTVLAAGLRLGWSAMISTATGYLWIALPPLFAALVLFVWGVVEMQAKLYGELSIASTNTISALQSEFAKHRDKFKKPNYSAVRLMHLYTLGDASRLWADLDQNSSGSHESSSWYDTFVSAVQQGKLKFISSWPGDSRMTVHEKQNPSWNTRVSREEFQRYAASINQDPPFLRDK